MSIQFCNAVKLLVIGSCTHAKEIQNCPSRLIQADFDDPSTLQRREAELAAWALPASELYTGWQHRYMMSGVKALRNKFGSSACSVKIVSAGYGLVDEEQRIVPYEVTFHGQRPKWIRERSSQLGVPAAIRKAVIGYDAVIFLLGKNYLISINPPLVPAFEQRFIFFTPEVGPAFDLNATIVPAGLKEVGVGSGITALKGKMFELLALGLCGAPEMWSRVLCDGTNCTALGLIEAGKKQLRSAGQR